MTDELSKEAAITLAAHRANEWFKAHAEQRIRLFNFYVILLAASLAGFVSTLSANLYPVTIVISLLLVVLTYAFKQLDRRSAKLVKDAERAQNKIDEMVAARLELAELRIADAAEQKKGIMSYRQSFNLIYLAGITLAALGAVVAILLFGAEGIRNIGLTA